VKNSVSDIDGALYWILSLIVCQIMAVAAIILQS